MGDVIHADMGSKDHNRITRKMHLVIFRDRCFGLVANRQSPSGYSYLPVEVSFMNCWMSAIVLDPSNVIFCWRDIKKDVNVK